MKYIVKATRTVEEEISVEVKADSEATARGFGSGPRNWNEADFRVQEGMQDGKDRHGYGWL